MQCRKHTLTLLGGPPGEVRVSAEALIEAIAALIEGAQRAARLFVDGESMRPGPRPAWLDAACRGISITGLQAGSTVIPIEAPTLAEAAPEHFGPLAPGSLFDEPGAILDTAQSAVDLFGNVLATALGGDRDALVADRALLDACARFVRATAGRGDTRGVRLEGIAGRATPVEIVREDLPRIELLRDETPPPSAARVTGTLDTISASSSTILVMLPDGHKIQARFADPDPELLRSLFGKRVTLSGMARFRPSGRLLLVDAEYLAPATPHDAMWERMPMARPGRASPVFTPVPQNPFSGVGAFFGIWPGNESDDELLAALAESA
jgi:hypothetical protein